MQQRRYLLTDEKMTRFLTRAEMHFRFSCLFLIYNNETYIFAIPLQSLFHKIFHYFQNFLKKQTTSVVPIALKGLATNLIRQQLVEGSAWEAKLKDSSNRTDRN